MIQYRGKRIIIYGLGSEYERNKSFLLNYFNIIGYSDRKVINIKGYVKPERLIEIKYDYIYITSKRFYSEISEFLRIEIGIPDYRIICEYDLFPELIKDNKTQLGAHFSIGSRYFDIVEFEKNIFCPLYNYQGVINDCMPKLFNEDGQRMDVFFLRDIHTAHEPYGLGKRVFYDRYNWKLDTHFYTHMAMKELIGNPSHRYGCFVESRAIVPEDYNWAKKNADYIKNNFDLFFTFDEDLLNVIPNSKYVGFASCPNYAMNVEDREWLSNQYIHKYKNISFLASAKEVCELHKLRKIVAKKCKQSRLADIYGCVDGGIYVDDIEAVLRHYRYSIVMENDISRYYWSERVANCFMAQTVPILLGATGIGEFFNTDGVISIDVDDCYRIEDILCCCSEEDYMSRLPAILDNFERVQKFRKSPWDMLYEEYLIDTRYFKEGKEI